ncbi:unnamed protein product [Bursaphelenchus okinawaensis]|uniref:ShKT domain-containing protein n=1 Tax=Bursaphelenchus okinawaensis TaxID=465554 RepID=A0A811KNE1_9BILA|nr:unnamed protein product [Bursaphelenchus okinawaensis]CAG9106676.1 unnamed protein product [Bursaphelenchus okinawaensis]
MKRLKLLSSIAILSTLLIPPINSQGYDFDTPPLTTTSSPTTTVINCNPWAITTTIAPPSLFNPLIPTFPPPPHVGFVALTGLQPPSLSNSFWGLPPATAPPAAIPSGLVLPGFLAKQAPGFGNGISGLSSPTAALKANKMASNGEASTALGPTSLKSSSAFPSASPGSEKPSSSATLEKLSSSSTFPNLKLGPQPPAYNLFEDKKPASDLGLIVEPNEANSSQNVNSSSINTTKLASSDSTGQARENAKPKNKTLESSQNEVIGSRKVTTNPTLTDDKVESVTTTPLRKVNIRPNVTSQHVESNVTTSTSTSSSRRRSSKRTHSLVPGKNFLSPVDSSFGRQAPEASSRDQLINKCLKTVCKDWVDECHWFCDYIQSNAQQQRCMECLSWRGKSCFSCFQM